MFNGQNCGLGSLGVLSSAKTYSISPENFKGEKGGGGRATKGTGEIPARELGKGWKISPSVIIKPHEEFVFAEIEGSGIIKHIWMTMERKFWRNMILKMYWEDAENPAVWTPVGDFFCNGWCEPTLISSLAITVNPCGGFNSYFEMPFLSKAKLVFENISDEECYVYYQVDFVRTELGKEIAYFHAQWNRMNPVPYKQDYVILQDVNGRGHYVGTYMARQVNSNGWWGEGEIKFFLDDDKEYPTICGTGTEDYFGGAWNFEQPKGEYCKYSTAYQGFTPVGKPDGLYRANMRFSMYRWHLTDPIIFEKNLKVTIQMLGWRNGNRYLPLQDDVATVAYWYHDKPNLCKRKFYGADDLEVI